MRSTRRLGRTVLGRLRRTRSPASLLTLLRVGFTEPPGSPRALVSSYLTVSPLPAAAPTGAGAGGRFVFCGTVPRVAPGWCCQPPCPVESGLSSTPVDRCRGRLADSPQIQYRGA